MPAGFNLGLVTAITSIAGTAGEILVNGGVAPVQGGAVVISVADGPSSISGEMYYLMTGISGALSTRLTASGVALIARDASISGGLEARIWATGAAAVAANLATIASTGQQAWTAANNNAINLSGRLTSTGAALVQRDIDISGGLEARIRATGAAAIAAVTSIIANTGQQAWTTAQNNAVNLSGRLGETGAALIQRDVDISGGIQARIHATGAVLIQRDLDISGGLQARVNATGAASVAYIDSRVALTGQAAVTYTNTRVALTGQAAISYTDIRVAASGQQAWAAAQNNATNLSGRLTATGAALIVYIANTSGVLAAQIAASAAGVTSVKGLSGALDLVGTGNLFVTTGSPNRIIISGSGLASSSDLSVTGSTLYQRDLEISGALAAQITASSTSLSGMQTPVMAGPTGRLTFNLSSDPALLYITITGATIISGVNYSAGAGLSVRIFADVTGCALSFPASWRFLSTTAPQLLPTGKVALLSIQSFTTTDSGVIAAYSVEL